MGIPAPAGVGASGAPPAGDQANAVLSGAFAAIGVSQPFAFRGPMNLAIWASLVDALTTTKGSLNASVASGTGIAVGQAVNSVNVPPGTTWATFASPNGTLALPAGYSTANIVSGTDAAAIVTGAGILYVGTVQIERSFDGGRTWIVCNVGGSGQLAQYNAGTPVSLTFGEPEKQVLYRLNCVAYTSGVINYRISQTGGAAESLAIGQLV